MPFIIHAVNFVNTLNFTEKLHCKNRYVDIVLSKEIFDKLWKFAQKNVARNTLNTWKNGNRFNIWFPMLFNIILHKP